MISLSLLVKQWKVEYRTTYSAVLDASGLSFVLQNIPTDTETVNLAQLGDVPKVKKIVGDVEFATLDEFQFVVGTTKYGAGLKVEDHLLKNHVARDNFNTAVRAMAQAQANHVSELITETVMPALDTSLGLDGAAFYSTDHPISSGVQSNKFAVSIADVDNPTLSELGNIFDTVRIGLKRMKSDTGRLINTQVTQWMLVCPLEYEAGFAALFSPLQETIVADGTAAISNRFRQFNVRVVGADPVAISGGTAPIHLWAMGAGLFKPLAFVEYVPGHMGQDMDPANEVHRFVTSGRYDVHPYQYHGAALIEVTTT